MSELLKEDVMKKKCFVALCKCNRMNFVFSPTYFYGSKYFIDFVSDVLALAIKC